MTLFTGLIAGLYPQLQGSACPNDPKNLTCNGNHTAFVIMYALTFFFANFGPKSTTFIVLAELFPARLRSTCHRISAALGKAGAIIGAFGFLYAAQPQDPKLVDSGYSTGIGIQNSLIILTVVNAVGFLFTFLAPETNQKSLEELSGEFSNEEVEEPKSKEEA